MGKKAPTFDRCFSNRQTQAQRASFESCRHTASFHPAWQLSLRRPRVHISSASATLPRAKRRRPPPGGRPIRKWRQPRGAGTKLATRLSARTESWSAKRTPLRGNYSPGSPAIHHLRRPDGVGRHRGTTDISAQGVCVNPKW